MSQRNIQLLTAIRETTQQLEQMIPTLEAFVQSGTRPSNSLEEQLMYQVDGPSQRL